MNTDELWKGFLQQAPHAADPEAVVKLRSRGLRALLDQAYAEGKETGAKLEIAKQSLRKAAGLDPIFGDLFGRNK